jgi:hypothetical protein
MIISLLSEGRKVLFILISYSINSPNLLVQLLYLPWKVPRCSQSCRAFLVSRVLQFIAHLIASNNATISNPILAVADLKSLAPRLDATSIDYPRLSWKALVISLMGSQKAQNSTRPTQI